MKSFRDRNPYAVGLVSVLVLGAATGCAFLVGTLKLLEDAYPMRGVFADASGLREGDDVRLAGVEVGRVTDIEVDRASGNVRVEWVVDDGIDIGEDAQAEIALKSLLGAKHIRINDPMAGDRGHRGARHRVAQRLPGRPRRHHRRQAGHRRGPPHRHPTGRSSREPARRGVRLAAPAGRLSETLADKDDELVSLLDSSQRILDLIVERRDDLALVLGETADTVQELDRIIRENEAQIDGALDSLAPTLDVVAANQADVDRALTWLGPGLLQQSRGGEQGPWQDIFVRGLGPDVLGALGDVYEIILGAEG